MPLLGNALLVLGARSFYYSFVYQFPTVFVLLISTFIPCYLPAYQGVLFLIVFQLFIRWIFVYTVIVLFIRIIGVTAVLITEDLSVFCRCYPAAYQRFILTVISLLIREPVIRLTANSLLFLSCLSAGLSIIHNIRIFETKLLNFSLSIGIYQSQLF